MFLGPLTESKPWDTRGIEGTYRFVRKVWRLFFDQNGKNLVVDAEPTKEELKALHKTIKKVNEDGTPKNEISPGRYIKKKKTANKLDLNTALKKAGAATRKKISQKKNKIQNPDNKTQLGI